MPPWTAFNIMFHAPMGRFQLELFIFITYFSIIIPFNVVFFPVGLSSLMRHFKHPTKPVENVALTTKGIQERKYNIEWDDGGKIGKNK